MLQVRTICPRCLLQPCALLFPLHHQAAISWLTFAPEAKWGITWPKSRAPVFHCIEDPLQAFCLGSPHVFWLTRFLSRREKCLSLGARTDISHFISTQASIQTNWCGWFGCKSQASWCVKKCQPFFYYYFFFRPLFSSSSFSCFAVCVFAMTFSVECQFIHVLAVFGPSFSSVRNCNISYAPFLLQRALVVK